MPIKEFFKEFIGQFIRYSGLATLLRKIFCKKGATIIVYHDPDPERFEMHIRYLSKFYNFITLETLVQAIKNEEWYKLPLYPLIVTIDDGYKRNYDLIKVFKRLKITPTVYLCSHIINTKRKFWFNTGISEKEMLKKIPTQEKLKLLKETINYDQEKEYEHRQALNLHEIEEMLSYCNFGSHGKFHSILVNCTDEECIEEITGSKKRLEELLNRKVKHFSYPNGDYGKREIQFLKSYGYESARTLDAGWNGPDSDPFRLKTMSIQNDASISILCGQICGLFSLIRNSMDIPV